MKRLIVCCDGTWVSSDHGDDSLPSNVARLARMIAHEGEDRLGKSVQQIVHYQAGNATSASELLTLPVFYILPGVSSATLEPNVAAAYQFIAANYSPGDPDAKPPVPPDEIFIFGFSRGAYTARTVAGLITKMGLLRAEELSLFPRAYEIYRKKDTTAVNVENHGYDKSRDIIKKLWTWAGAVKNKESGPEEIWQLRKAMHDGPVKVKVVGVWDTVGSRGLPESSLTKVVPCVNEEFKFHDTALHENIEHAFHALALDEHRGSLPPTLWHLPNSNVTTELKQCWFPGFHNNVGGGTSKIDTWTEDSTDIDELSLAWMCDQVDGMLAFNDRAVKRFLGRKCEAKNSWATGKIVDTTTMASRWPMSGGDAVRTPGGYHYQKTEGRLVRRPRFPVPYEKVSDPSHEDVNFLIQEATGMPVIYKGQSFRTNETIHPSVKHRATAMDHPQFGYRPIAFSERIDWPYLRQSAPEWEWIDTKTGDGAHWMRPTVPKLSGWLWTYPTEREVRIEEWAIKEVKGLNNFEARLLPNELMLDQYTLNKIRLETSEEGTDGLAQVFWTRTGKHDPKIYKKRIAGTEKPPRPLSMSAVSPGIEKYLETRPRSNTTGTGTEVGAPRLSRTNSARERNHLTLLRYLHSTMQVLGIPAEEVPKNGNWH
ncbi:hypothetical protein HDK77DRAFT_480857 [Phyllosticta capitalensis]